MLVKVVHFLVCLASVYNFSLSKFIHPYSSRHEFPGVSRNHDLGAGDKKDQIAIFTHRSHVYCQNVVHHEMGFVEPCFDKIKMDRNLSVIL